MNIVEKINNQIINDPLSKEDFIKQFYEKTELLGIKHTFNVEEAWEIACEIRNRNAFRLKALDVQERNYYKKIILQMTRKLLEKVIH